jgi:hypothetical protein
MQKDRVPLPALAGVFATALLALAAPQQAQAAKSYNASHSNTATVDIRHGAYSGKRRHQPIKIRREIDSASPKLLNTHHRAANAYDLGHGQVTGRRMH